MDHVLKTLVFSGGALKCLSFIGVLKKLKENDLINEVIEICGVSAGAIFALAFVLGYSVLEMETIIKEFNFESIVDYKITNILEYNGFDTGNGIISFVKTLLLKKDIDHDITFDQLFLKTGINLIIYTTNLSTFKYQRFDKNDNIKVLSAIRGTISLPLIFTTKKIKGDIHLDGGLINNFPINDFPTNTTLGFKIQQEFKINNLVTFKEYIVRLFELFLYQRDQLNDCNNKNNCVYIKITELNCELDFCMSNECKQEIINDGYNCTTNFLINE